MLPPQASTCFFCQYQALEKNLGDVEFLGERRSFSAAAKRFGEFRHALEEHLSAEEAVLVPLYVENARGDAGQLVEQFRSSRARVDGAMNDVSAALSQADHSAFCQSMSALDTALEHHRAIEEASVHPALDTVLVDDSNWESARRLARLAACRHDSPSRLGVTSAALQ